MAYSEKDGQVVLTLSREDYTQLLLELGGAMFLHLKDGDGSADQTLAWLNRIMEGNPHYSPYLVTKQVAKK